MKIAMPKLNDLPDEKGVIAELLVEVGDPVAKGTVVMTVEMAKAIVEVESPYAGRIACILVAEGGEVTPGQTLIELQ